MNAERNARIEAWRNIVVVHDTLMKEFQADLKRDAGITVAQYDALLRLEKAPDQAVRMTVVAEAMLYSSGAATKVFDRLVERGLVERGNDPDDRRAVTVRLTPDGKRLIHRAMRDHGRSIIERFGPFDSEAEAQHVTAYLRRQARTVRGDPAP